jgi:signal peptidase I
VTVLERSQPISDSVAPARRASRTRQSVRRRGGKRGARSWSRIFAAVVTAALIVLAWVAFAPPQLGGKVSYVVTDGISMLPEYHAGDLIVLRKQSSYNVGEVAGYHNSQLGVVVMHRIVARDGNRFVFKGDNNDFEDAYHPTAAQIVGAEWLHIPRVGELVKQLRVPVVAAILLGLLWIYAFGPSPVSRRQRRRRHHHAR